MAFQIGTDEAGYGPNLGPLTICGTLWETRSADTELYDVLSEVLSAERDPSKLSVADSKAVYTSSGSIEKLETTVLAMLWACTGSIPANWTELTTLLQCPPTPQVWMNNEQKRLPLEADVKVVERYKNLLLETFANTGGRLVECRLTAVFPNEFNGMVDRLGNKAELLSAKTLGIVDDLLSKSEGDIFVGCDKHGGRNKYLGLIHQYLTDELVRIEIETPKLSRYRWNKGQNSIEMQFSVQGEYFLPTALASMIAKYVREVSMEIWNDFWRLELPDLKPTKGYPQDAKRFRQEIEATRKRVGIHMSQIWRNR